LVKLADRLHNMRTLQFMPADKQQRIAQETMDIYAPLAGRMGMQDMRNELEDISFRVLQPEHYQAIVARLDEMQAAYRETISTISTELSERLAAEGITARVKARVKSPFSIFNKIERKSIALEQLSDMIGFRVIVGSLEECYRTVGVVHTKWKVVPGRFKDYISVPKHNDYQSIHTTIVGPGRQRVELQIRTSRMQDIAERGVAAHALYKDGSTGGEGLLSKDSRAYSWLRQTIEALSVGDNPEEFLEHTKLELFQDQVFCFTPKGQLIALPRGATPIDFAYAVHTDVGDTCVGAKINGRIMPLVTRLANGDEVEILRSGVQVPPPAWEEIVVTGKARAAIRRATKAAVRKQYSGLGMRILERTFNRAGKPLSRDGLKPVLHRLGQKDVEDMLAAVGRGEIVSEDVFKAVYPNHQETRVSPRKPADEGWFNLRSAAGLIFKLPGLSKSQKSTTTTRKIGPDPDMAAMP
ncbi:MAG: DUF5913 domain-containing protein, partial [Hoeflea sp.]|nr:DUF5913 domain-containing protein [Hoeflea sp.]